MRRTGPLLLFTALLVACAQAPTPTPTPTPTATLSPTPTAAPQPTPSPAVEPTVTPDMIPEQPRPTPTVTQRPTPTPWLIVPDGGQGEPDCVSDPNPRFTALHTDLSRVSFIIPMIVPSSNWLKNRSYVALVREPGTLSGYEVPVYAPVDSTLVGITRYLGPGSDPSGTIQGIEEYDLRFEVSCEVSYGFDHVRRLVGSAAEVQPETASVDTRGAQKSVRVEYKAGDLIGYTTGTEAAHTWDFIVENTASEIRFANQERYETVGDLARLRNASCPFDYYDEPHRSQYLSLLGGWSEGRVGGDDCLGSPDVHGTIAGGWFASKWNAAAASDVAEWGAVVVQTVDGAVEVHDGRVMVRTRAGAPTHIAPAEVTGAHCYEHGTSQRFAFVKLVGPDMMAIATGSGPCPEALPEANKIVYR